MHADDGQRGSRHDVGGGDGGGASSRGGVAEGPTGANPRPLGRKSGSGLEGTEAAPARAGGGGGVAGRVDFNTGGADADGASFFFARLTADMKSLPVAKRADNDVTRLSTECWRLPCNMKEKEIISMSLQK